LLCFENLKFGKYLSKEIKSAYESINKDNISNMHVHYHSNTNIYNKKLKTNGIKINKKIKHKIIMTEVSYGSKYVI